MRLKKWMVLVGLSAALTLSGCDQASKLPKSPTIGGEGQGMKNPQLPAEEKQSLASRLKSRKWKVSYGNGTVSANFTDSLFESHNPLGTVSYLYELDESKMQMHIEFFKGRETYNIELKGRDIILRAISEKPEFKTVVFSPEG